VTYNNVNHIHEKAEGDDHDHLSSQIAFSRLGLNTIGVMDDVGDKFFDGGPMKDQKYFLGDRSSWDDAFKKGDTHAVILVTAKS
jgi:hypothetical protein